MAQSRRLTDLKNIGQKRTDRKTEIGIFSEDELRHVGAACAHRVIKGKYSDETLPVCYYRYSFDGALVNKHWNKIGELRKQQLESLIG